jgi:LysR family transcriptional regulator, low CO2-responsive transcriptional regulator
MISLYKLEIFVTVFRLGSFSAAAKQLYMSQPAVSQHIQDIERHLGARLFERGGSRGVTPTPSGVLLHEYAVKIIDMLAEAENRLTIVENLPEGQIHAGATPGISTYLFPGWLQTFREQYPNLTLHLQTGITSRVIQGVLSQDFNYGFVEGEIDDFHDSRLTHLVLCETPMLLVVGREHPWWGRPAVSIHEFDGEPFITRQTDSRTRRWLDQTFALHDVKPSVAAAFDSPEAIKTAIMSSMGAAILPEYVVQHEMQNGAIRAVPVKDAPFTRHLRLVWSKNATFSPVALAFLKHLSRRQFMSLRGFPHDHAIPPNLLDH